jgi:hypothetical protein
MDMPIRPRRLRVNETMRRLVRETRVSKSAFVYPLFVRSGSGVIEDISSLPGQKRCTPDRLPALLEAPVKAGVSGILLFGIPAYKDETGSPAWAEDGPVQQAVREVKRHFPQLCVITDVCLCEYTSHGHCGIVENGLVDNDRTLALLSRTAFSHAQAGAEERVLDAGLASETDAGAGFHPGAEFAAQFQAAAGLFGDGLRGGPAGVPAALGRSQGRPTSSSRQDSRRESGHLIY